VKNKLVKNGLYNSIGGVIRIGLGVLTIPIMIRQIGLAEYGLWTLAFSVVSIVILAEAGLSTAVTVFASEDLRQEDNTGLQHTLSATLLAIFTLATLAAAFLLLGSDWIVSLFDSLTPTEKMRVAIALRIGALVVWAKLIQQVLVGMEQAYERYDIINIVNSGTSIGTAVCTIAAVSYGGRIIELMILQAAISVISLVAHATTVASLFKSNKIPWRLQFNLQKTVAIIKYSFVMWLTILGGVIFSRFDRIIVGNMMGTQILGVYSAITDMTVQINVFSALAVQPIISSLTPSRIQEEAEAPKVREQVKHSLLINLAVALVFGAILTATAPWIVEQVLRTGQTGISYIKEFRIAVMIYSMYSINAVGYYILLATNRVKTASTVSLIVGVCSLLTIFIGCHYWGLIGALIGNATFLGVNALTFYGMKTVKVPMWDWLKILVIPVGSFFLIAIIGILTEIDQTVLAIVWFLFSCIMATQLFKKSR
jgi:O-antigen/teichoic acid export membrane protein